MLVRSRKVHFHAVALGAGVQIDSEGVQSLAMSFAKRRIRDPKMAVGALQSCLGVTGITVEVTFFSMAGPAKVFHIPYLQAGGMRVVAAHTSQFPFSMSTGLPFRVRIDMATTAQA